MVRVHEKSYELIVEIILRAAGDLGCGELSGIPQQDAQAHEDYFGRGGFVPGLALCRKASYALHLFDGLELMPLLDEGAKSVGHLLVAGEQKAKKFPQLKNAARDLALQILHKKLLVAAVTVFFRAVEQIVHIIKKQIQRLLLIVDGRILGLNAQSEHYLRKAGAHGFEQPIIFIGAAPCPAGQPEIRTVAPEPPVAQRHTGHHVHLRNNVENIVGKAGAPVIDRQGRSDGIDKNIVL